MKKIGKWIKKYLPVIATVVIIASITIAYFWVKAHEGYSY